jgi:hypothetical protein
MKAVQRTDAIQAPAILARFHALYLSFAAS